VGIVGRGQKINTFGRGKFEGMLEEVGVWVGGLSADWGQKWLGWSME